MTWELTTLKTKRHIERIPKSLTFKTLILEGRRRKRRFGEHFTIRGAEKRIKLKLAWDSVGPEELLTLLIRIILRCIKVKVQCRKSFSVSVSQLGMLPPLETLWWSSGMILHSSIFFSQIVKLLLPGSLCRMRSKSVFYSQVLTRRKMEKSVN